MTENIPESLAAYGWDSFFNNHFVQLNIPDSIPCRIISEYKSSYRVQGEDGERAAVLAGRMRYDIDPEFGYPAVGDWVVAVQSDEQQCVIHAILPRKSKFWLEASRSSKVAIMVRLARLAVASRRMPRSLFCSVTVTERL